MPAVIRSIDRSLRHQQPQLARCFAPLSPETIDSVTNVVPRELARQLRQAYGIAVKETGANTSKVRGLLQLNMQHLKAATKKVGATRISMGFGP